MTTEPMLDRRLRELMAELAAPGDQSAAIDNVISVTRALRPEPRWRALLKERPMRTNSIVIAGSPPMRFGLIFAVIALIALLAATVVVGALVLRQPALPPAYGPAGNGVLAYAEGGDIVTAAADGSNVTAVTTGPAIDSRPVFSRDGTRIAFLRKESLATRLFVANADGTGQVAISPELFDDVHAIDWSPDGDRLLVLGDLLREPRRSMSILVLAADGSGSADPIELGEVSPNGWAAWRPPAGGEIVFRGHPTVDDPAVGLYAVGPGGGSPRILKEPIGPAEFDPAIDRPAISPDGRTVTFWSWETNASSDANGFGRLLNVDTGVERTASTWGGSTSPISPDGRWVVGAGSGLTFESVDGDEQGFSIGADLDVNGADLAFSPDGTQVLGRSNPDSGLDGWFVMDIESGEATQLDVPPDASVSWQRVALP
jgi:dipeptidyl aminopeptidase/acylaminoacyl peptidase